jgi:diguanylate cyclase (GGDEF)-like protein
MPALKGHACFFLRARVTTHIKFPGPQQHHELQVLHDVARTLISSLDLDQVLWTIMQQMAQSFRPETWSLFMVEDATQELYCVAGADGGQEQHRRIPMGEGIPGWVALHGEPLILAHPQEDLRFQETLPDGSKPAETVICLPLRSRSHTHGVIQLVNCHLDAMHDHDMFFLHALCDYAAIAIQNVRAMEQIQKLTITDDCTGLYNSRHLYEMLESALERGSRKHQPVSLIFLDLDHFKQVNDTHGHLIGSKLLAEVGRAIRNNIGPLCTAYRYGGDEFVVLLPGMGKGPSIQTALHLLETLHNTLFLQEDGLEVSLQASFGVATAPEDGRNLHEIILAADTAMYTVKNSTRNAVAAAGNSKTTPVIPIHARH